LISLSDGLHLPVRPQKGRKYGKSTVNHAFGFRYLFSQRCLLSIVSMGKPSGNESELLVGIYLVMLFNFNIVLFLYVGGA